MISRRSFLSVAATAPMVGAQIPRPNLVLFLADDHGYWDSSVYGCRAVRTPNLQRLADEGLTFSNAFSGAAICIPSRAILASGLCSHRNGAIASGRQMREGIKTLPAYMTELGYRVAHFGKSHFLPATNYTKWESVPSEFRREGGLNHDLDPEALEKWLVGRDASDQRPLCLIVCCHSPHVIWEQNKDYDPAKVELPPTFVDTRETRTARANYYTDITKMDTQLGQVYASVRRHLGRNTLFLCTSDNGAQSPFGKWNLYDAGIRLPMVAVWPGVLRGGGRTEAMVHFTDFLPSFIELAGGKAPKDIDGKSFALLLRGRSSRHRTHIFASHTADNNSQMNSYPMRAVRTARYKYIRNLYPELSYQTHIDRALGRDGRDAWDSWVRKAHSDPTAAAIVRRYHKRPPEELYDVAADLHEMKNLAADRAHAAVLTSLRRKVDEWMKGMNDNGEIFGVPRPLKDFKMPV